MRYFRSVNREYRRAMCINWKQGTESISRFISFREDVEHVQFLSRIGLRHSAALASGRVLKRIKDSKSLNPKELSLMIGILGVYGAWEPNTWITTDTLLPSRRKLIRTVSVIIGTWFGLASVLNMPALNSVAHTLLNDEVSVGFRGLPIMSKGKKLDNVWESVAFFGRSKHETLLDLSDQMALIQEVVRYIYVFFEGKAKKETTVNYKALEARFKACGTNIDVRRIIARTPVEPGAIGMANRGLVTDISPKGFEIDKEATDAITDMAL